MQATTREPLQLGGWVKALMDWTHQLFCQKPEPSSRPGGQQNRKQLNFLFLPRTLYGEVARPSGTVSLEGKQTTDEVWSESCKISNSCPGALGQEGKQTYWAYADSQDFTYTILLNPHRNTGTLGVLFLFTKLQRYRKQIQRAWTMCLEPRS